MLTRNVKVKLFNCLGTFSGSLQSTGMVCRSNIAEFTRPVHISPNIISVAVPRSQTIRMVFGQLPLVLMVFKWYFLTKPFTLQIPHPG
jgi:hypothetical protein